ncbi:MAG: hypothetical protein WCI74_11925, partial [Actinomycetes bacterium]
PLVSPAWSASGTATTTVGGTTTLHIEIPTDAAPGSSLSYYVNAGLYSDPVDRTFPSARPMTGTAAGMIARQAGTAAAAISYGTAWLGQGVNSVATVDLVLEGVSPGKVYVAFTAMMYNGTLYSGTAQAKKTIELTVTPAVAPPVTPPVVTPPVVTPPTVPGPPSITGIAAKKGGKVTVAYSVGNTGGRAITSGAARCTPVKKGKAKSGRAASGPILVKGLIKGQTYKCQVQVSNAVGVSGWSAVSKVKAK